MSTATNIYASWSELTDFETDASNPGGDGQNQGGGETDGGSQKEGNDAVEIIMEQEAGNNGADEMAGETNDNGNEDVIENPLADKEPVVNPPTNTTAAGEREPKTGDTNNFEIYATAAMIAGLTYLLLYFTDKERGMTEEEKKEIVSTLIRWAKQGHSIRRYLAMTAIFCLLVYYHSIGKRGCTKHCPVSIQDRLESI